MGLAHLLVVEDDQDIGSELCEALVSHGYSVDLAVTAADAERRADQGRAELILLDLGLLDRDGVALCRRLRAQQPGAVIVVLTARTLEVEVVVALDAGAETT